jgi:NIMA (never in mitosis gene a)-related kinase
MSIKDFEILSVLGKGAYGSVYKVRRFTDSKIYAMKKIILNNLNTREKEGCLNEVRLLASITNNNIISYKDSFLDNETNNLHIIMEHADDNDLQYHINENKKTGKTFSEERVWEILNHLVNGLKALHDRKIMHRDLKSANVFLFKDGSVKIGDMNVSKVYKLGLLNTQTGTPYYASPEVWRDLPYDHKCDIWSLGIVLYEICNSKVPFAGDSIHQVFNKIIKGAYEPVCVLYSSELREIVNMLLQVNPNDRPNIDKIIYLLRKRDKGNMLPKFENFKLLKTIRVPRNLKDINQLLPKSKYRVQRYICIKKCCNEERIRFEDF